MSGWSLVPSAALVLSVLSLSEKCPEIIYGTIYVTLGVVWEPLALLVAWWSLFLPHSTYIGQIIMHTYDYKYRYITDTYRGDSLVVGVLIIPLF